MDTEEIHDDKMWRNIEKSQRRGKIMGGLLLVAIGSLFLAKELGVEIPAWIFTWKMLLIGIGLVTAIKNKFLHPAWVILVGIGVIFLLNDVFPEMQIRPFLWPVLIIALGLAIVFKPRRKNMQYAHHYWKKWHQDHPEHRGWANRQQWRGQLERTSDARTNSPEEEYIDSVSFLGGTKKNIISKTFKGGDIVNVLGGSQLNLSRADIQGTVTLSVTQVFGGTKLIVPANWEIKLSETVTICGGIEDKRPLQTPASGDEQKVLILAGTTVFGGIEIKSFE
jgi:predicted membrane protein